MQTLKRIGFLAQINYLGLIVKFYYDTSEQEHIVIITSNHLVMISQFSPLKDQNVVFKLRR